MENFDNKKTLKTLTVTKNKYWYRDCVDVCVICGHEVHNKERVYNESEKGVFYYETACWSHF